MEKTKYSKVCRIIHWAIAFIVIHLAGVFIGEFTNQKGIISRIVSGAKKEE